MVDHVGPSRDIPNVEKEYIDRSAFNERLFTRQFKNRGSNDIMLVGEKYKVQIMRLLEHYMKKHGALTFFIVIQCELVKPSTEGEEDVYKDTYFHGKNRRLLTLEEFEKIYGEAMDCINSKLGEHMTDDSWWMMYSIKNININIAKYTPIRGSSFIHTPQSQVNKMALLNVKIMMMTFVFSMPY